MSRLGQHNNRAAAKCLVMLGLIVNIMELSISKLGQYSSLLFNTCRPQTFCTCKKSKRWVVTKNYI